MKRQSLATILTHFANATQQFNENILNNKTWAWQAYEPLHDAFLQTKRALRLNHIITRSRPTPNRNCE